MKQSAEVDGLIATATRQPFQEAAVVAPFVWGFSAIGGAFVFKPWLTSPGGYVFDRITVVLAVSAVFAVSICWWHTRLIRKKVAAAKAEITGLIDQATRVPAVGASE